MHSSRPSYARPVERETPSEDDLVRALLSDPAAALGAVYDRHARLVYGLARSILASQHEAEDITQEVFLGLCGKYRYDPARGNLAAFLVTVTRSRALDRLRSRGRKLQILKRWGREIAGEGFAPDPAAEASQGEMVRSVRGALARLPENERRVLELAYYGGLSQSEIASRLAAPLGTVKTWARRGLFTLRDALKDVAG
jgi:RNA polymerase sigma-70 factor, ECF subfamily